MSLNNYGLGKRKKSRFGLMYFIFLVSSALMAMMYGTQTVASAYGFHAGLGAPVFGTYYWPWKLFVWSETIKDTHGVIAQAISQSQLLFVAPQMVFLLFWAVFGRKPKGQEDVHGTAAWAKEKEIKEAGLLDGDGVYVGGWENKGELKYLRHNGPEHVAAFAPTRSGKGVCLVLPTLLSWLHSAVVLDIKGEAWALTSGWRKKAGQKVFKFDPTDTTGASAKYNPLATPKRGHL